MANMVKDPHSKDHYAYLNELLALEESKRLKAGQEISETLIKQAKTKLEEMNAEKEKASTAELEANISKIQRALETLQNEEKRKLYDTGLKNGPSIKLEIEGKEKGVSLIPLVPVEDIISEFNDFKKEQLEKKDDKNNPLFAEGNFKYEKVEGPPTKHVFTFPDQASANAFIERLFNKNMAMLPNGSQNIEDVKKQQKQQSMKEKITNIKSKPDAVVKEGPAIDVDDQSHKTITNP